MADEVSLMSYLQTAMPAIPASPPLISDTDSHEEKFSEEAIKGLTPWPDFNLEKILQQYQPLLEEVHLAPNPMPDSPPRGIAYRSSLWYRFAEYLIPRMRRALRATFEHLERTNQMAGLTAVSFDIGNAARWIEEDFNPAYGFVEPKVLVGTGPNRAPGVLKTSWEWNTSMGQEPPRSQEENEGYHQALREVNWWMRQYGSRYGFVITDKELVVLRRLNKQGHLELAQRVSLTIGGLSEAPELTVLLALWHLGMLAAQDEGDGRWAM